MRRLLLILHLSLFFLVVNTSNSQPTNPVPYDLSDGPYMLISWDSSSMVNPGGTYPPNMIFHQTKKIDPQLADEMDTDWKCPYNLDSRSRFEGLGDDGIGFINTGQTQEDSVCIYPGYVGEVVLALRTIGFKNIHVSWKAGLVSLSGNSNRQYCIRFQYRLGNSGEFADIIDSNGNPVEYNYSGYLNNYPHPPNEQLFSLVLPQETGDRILVQLRWKYYYLPNDSASGTRPKMKVDDIFVNGEMINSVNNEETSEINIINVSPNPFSESCTIKSDHNSEIVIFDSFGRSIANGKGELVWKPDGSYSQGIYYYSVCIGNKYKFGKIVFLR